MKQTNLTPLTPAERERGWVIFSCSRHGGLVATTPAAVVTCRCGRRAKAAH
jgi:hypothetical protein